MRKGERETATKIGKIDRRDAPLLGWHTRGLCRLRGCSERRGRRERELCGVVSSIQPPFPSLQASACLHPHCGTVCLASPGFFSIPPHSLLKPARGPRQTAGLVIVTGPGPSSVNTWSRCIWNCAVCECVYTFSICAWFVKHVLMCPCMAAARRISSVFHNYIYEKRYQNLLVILQYS